MYTSHSDSSSLVSHSRYTYTSSFSRSLLMSLLMVSGVSGVSVLSAFGTVPVSPPSGGIAGGIFSAYFQNMQASCAGTNPVVTGFDATLFKTCTPFSQLMGSLMSGAPGLSGQVVTGFDTTTGLPLYGPGSPWNTSGGNITYTGGNVGIGTVSPTAKLDVVGTGNFLWLKLPTGAFSGYVLTSDASGSMSWKAPVGSDSPVGTISAFNLASCPSGWAPADGTASTPDLRGEFIRWWDNGRGVDTGRVLGSAQVGTSIRSYIYWDSPWGGALNVYSANREVASPISWGYPWYFSMVSYSTYNGWSMALYSPAFSTRPRNVALLYCIKISGSSVSPSYTGTWINTNGTSAGNVTLATTGNVWIGTVNPSTKLDVAWTAKVNKIQLGNKWLLSGVGDAYGNDDWLRLFRADGTANYYGWIAMDKLWTSTAFHANGQIYQNQWSNYDVWIQWWVESTWNVWGTARNLAILGEKATDKLYINYYSEYAGGTDIGGPVNIRWALTINGSAVGGGNCFIVTTANRAVCYAGHWYTLNTGYESSCWGNDGISLANPGYKWWWNGNEKIELRNISGRLWAYGVNFPTSVWDAGGWWLWHGGAADRALCDLTNTLSCDTAVFDGGYTSISVNQLWITTSCNSGGYGVSSTRAYEY